MGLLDYFETPKVANKLLGLLREKAPEVYGSIGGLLGTAPDQFEGSVLDPMTARVRSGAEAGFPVGTALQIAPLVGNMLSRAVSLPRRPGIWQRGGIDVPALTFDDELLKAAIADTRKAPPIILSDLDADAMGVIPKRARQLDRAINRGVYKESDLQDAWSVTRNLLKERYGDTVKLFRADAPKADHAADTLTVYMADKNIAQKYANNGRQVGEYTVPIDDVLAVYARPSGYYEAIVRRRALGGNENNNGLLRILEGAKR